MATNDRNFGLGIIVGAAVIAAIWGGVSLLNRSYRTEGVSANLSAANVTLYADRIVVMPSEADPVLNAKPAATEGLPSVLWAHVDWSGESCVETPIALEQVEPGKWSTKERFCGGEEGEESLAVVQVERRWMIFTPANPSEQSVANTNEPLRIDFDAVSFPDAEATSIVVTDSPKAP